MMKSSARRAIKHRQARTLSRLRKPQDLSLEVWQRELRRQFGREQQFDLKNIGRERFFSEFQVRNPRSASTYRVAIRGAQPGDNYCNCADFSTNTLGTCKHIEFVLGQLEQQKGGAAALRRGFEPPYSEIVLRYGAKREVRFRPGTDCPRGLAALAAEYFGAQRTLRTGAFAKFESFLSEAASSSTIFDATTMC